MYHKKNVDYAYLLWEDFVYQVKNKNVKKSNEMYYPRFTKVIINFFMAKDKSIPRRNSVNWHYARDDYMFTTIKVISMHEDTQLYGAILPNKLTNEDIRNSESFKEYYVIASGAEPPKQKQVSRRNKLDPTRQQQAEQLNLVTERSKTQTYISHASDSCADKGTVNVSEDDDTDNDDDVDKDINDDDADNQDDDNEQMDSDNNGDDFVHPKFLTHDEEERDKASFDPRVQTPSHVESTNDEDDNEEVQGVNIEGQEIDEEANSEETEGNELYKDLNINVEGRDVEITDAQPTNVQTTQVTEDTHVIITSVIPEGQQRSSSVLSGFVSNMLNPRPDTCIDSIFTLNTEATSLVDVPVTTIAKPPFMSVTTLPPHHTYATNTSSYTNNCSKLLPARSSQLWLFIRMHEAIKTAVQLQSERLRDEAQAKNADFLNKLDDNIKKIIKDHVKEQVKAQVSKILPKIEKTVNEQLEAEVMTCSSTESKTSLAIAANLSELKLKKILIEKIESNKSIHISDEQKNLYKALYTKGKKTPKSTGKSTKGSKSLHKYAGESAHAEEPMHTAKDLEEPIHQEFETRDTEDQPVDETPQPSDWF
ncbi:hypothetical protein Tco_0429231 [Tanacetum coccineum]